jgi:hypothetical protein
MKAIWNYLAGALLALAASVAAAAVDQADKLAPEPTVGTVWIVVFLVIFVLFCLGVGIGIYRADKKSKTEAMNRQ